MAKFERTLDHLATKCDVITHDADGYVLRITGGDFDQVHDELNRAIGEARAEGSWTQPKRRYAKKMANGEYVIDLVVAFAEQLSEM